MKRDKKGGGLIYWVYAKLKEKKKIRFWLIKNLWRRKILKFEYKKCQKSETVRFCGNRMVITLGLTVGVCGRRERLGLNGCLMSRLGPLRSSTL